MIHNDQAHHLSLCQNLVDHIVDPVFACRLIQCEDHRLLQESVHNGKVLALAPAQAQPAN